MARVTYITAAGAAHVLELASGVSVMEGAKRNNVPGIVAECGGLCTCATCHVYVDEAWLQAVGPRTLAEEGLIEFVVEPRPNSRLSCQIKATDELDGLVVKIPESQ